MKKLLITIGSLLFAGSLAAQDIQFKPAVGGGSIFDEEAETFDTDNLFGSFQVDMVDLAFVDTGAAVEFNYDGTLNYSVWNLNRVDVMKNLYGGSDVKLFGRDATGTDFDFDFRVVVGYRVTKDVALEIYSLEDTRPLAFAFFYRF